MVNENLHWSTDIYIGLRTLKIWHCLATTILGRKFILYIKYLRLLFVIVTIIVSIFFQKKKFSLILSYGYHTIKEINILLLFCKLTLQCIWSVYFGLGLKLTVTPAYFTISQVAFLLIFHYPSSIRATNSKLLSEHITNLRPLLRNSWNSKFIVSYEMFKLRELSYKILTWKSGQLSKFFQNRHITWGICILFWRARALGRFYFEAFMSEILLAVNEIVADLLSVFTIWPSEPQYIRAGHFDSCNQYVNNVV